MTFAEAAVRVVLAAADSSVAAWLPGAIGAVVALGAAVMTARSANRATRAEGSAALQDDQRELIQVVRSDNTELRERVAVVEADLRRASKRIAVLEHTLREAHIPVPEEFNGR